MHSPGDRPRTSCRSTTCCRRCSARYGEDVYYRTLDPQGGLQPRAGRAGGGGGRTCSSCPRRCPRALAHDITKVLFEEQATLATIHPQAQRTGVRDGDQGRHRPVPSRRRSASTASAAPGRSDRAPGAHARRRPGRRRCRAPCVRVTGWLGTVARALGLALSRLRPLLGAGDRAGAGLPAHVPAARPGRRVPDVPGARLVPRARVTAADGLFIALAAVRAALAASSQGQAFELRAATPTAMDVVLGVALPSRWCWRPRAAPPG